MPTVYYPKNSPILKSPGSALVFMGVLDLVQANVHGLLPLEHPGLKSPGSALVVMGCSASATNSCQRCITRRTPLY